MESAINSPTMKRPTNRRAYLAGGGATAALVAAAVIIFLGVAAFVGFEGLPFGTNETEDTTVNLTSDAPQAAAAAAGGTADAVASTPATPDAAAAAEILASLPPSVVAALEAGATGPGGTTGPGPASLGTIDLGAQNPNLGGTATTPGALGNLVAGLDNTTSGLGLNLGLSGLTDDLTAPLDKAVTDTGNNVGKILGNPKLGDNLNKTVNGVTDQLLGNGGGGGLLGLGR